MTEQRWHRGDTVIVRYPVEDRMVRAYQAERGDFTVNVLAWPQVVLQDTDELVALYLPEGTRMTRWDVGPARVREQRTTQGDSVRLLYPGKRYEVSLFYDTGTGSAPWVQYYFPGVSGRFYGWKVDLARPFARTDLGFDLIDDVLDITINPDRSFVWRDVDDMARFVELGIYTQPEADDLHAIGEEVLLTVQRREPPFDDTWQAWQPTPDLVIGREPEGWQFLPVPAPYKTYKGPLS